MLRPFGTCCLVMAALTVLVPAPSALEAQASPYDRYLNHQELTGELQRLASAHGNLASLRALARSDQGRELWLLTLSNPASGDPEERPALLLVANLEGNHLIGSSTALFTAEHLLTAYGQDEEVTRLLDERTVYILPRVNPDGAELHWSMPAYELPYKPHPSAPERGGLNAREMGRDLNGDGVITLMRVRDPEGPYMVDPDEPRLLRRAERARAERGIYSIYVEGIELDQLDAYVPHGSDGVNPNRNFPHEYLYYQPHVGPHQVSEVETRALADFMFERVNIAAVLTFSPYDNLRSPPPSQRSAPSGTAPGPPQIPSNILAEDRPFHQFISERFNEITELKGEGATDEAGSFAQFAYYQVGLPSFTTPVWAVTDERAAPPADAGAEEGEGVAGDWTISLEMQGQSIDATLSIEEEGGGLVANLDSPGGSVRLTGQGVGDRFTASGEVPQIGAISVQGQVSGSQLTGSVDLGPMGSAPFTGIRIGGGAAAPRPGARQAGNTPEHRWLNFLDEQGIDGFVEWGEAEHPTLGPVEVGGFLPNVRVNAPPERIRELAERHARFAVWLGGQLPEVELVETTVERRGDNVFLVTATVSNQQYLPTHFQMGARVRTNQPVTIRLLPTDGMTVLTGNIREQIPLVQGMGGRETFTWLVQATPGTSVELQLFAERAGGLQSTTLTLR